MYCSKLFEIEDKIAELPQAEQYAQRQKRARPILDAFLAWAKTRNVAPKSALVKLYIIFWNSGRAVNATGCEE